MSPLLMCMSLLLACMTVGNDSKARRKIGDYVEFKEANFGTKIKTSESLSSFVVLQNLNSWILITWLCHKNVLLSSDSILAEKVKIDRKSKRKNLRVPADNSKLEENHREIDPTKVDEISSVDEDCSRGMKSIALLFFLLFTIVPYSAYLC